ncbi:SWI/SNF complex protein [Flagelloscypha sp. PMI_526]|nr:SWI/SNF complex protein [Flagelloscypha sp. PMI_526]
MEISDALSRPPSTTRTLRLFLSHTVSGQAWQTNSMDNDAEKPDFETGEGIAAWQFKLDGRLLEMQRSKGPPSQRKFSTLVKKMMIELERDPTLYPDGNVIEWPRISGPSASNPALDGFTVRRTGDQPTKIRVVLYLEHYPEQFKVHHELASILNISQASRMDCLKALWDYVKINGLQDRADRRTIKLDDSLKYLFNVDAVPFFRLADLANQFLMPVDPIVLNYEIDPSVAPPEKPQGFDVTIQVEDAYLRSKMQSFVTPSRDTTSRINKLDEEIAGLAQSLHNSELKRAFLAEFAENPTEFIQTWLESQSRDLDAILAPSAFDGQSIRTEELRRSEFFRMPWVEEGVSVYHGQKMAGVLSQAQQAAVHGRFGM